LSTPYDTGGRTSPFANGSSTHNVTWASAQARSAEVKGQSSFNPRNQGFFSKHFRRISTSLPVSYGEKEKLGRGRSQNNKFMQFLNRIGWNIWRLRRSVGVVLLVFFSILFFYVTRKSTARTLLASH
jgi:mannan polymerase II complex MNN10 subunit